MCLHYQGLELEINNEKWKWKMKNEKWKLKIENWKMKIKNTEADDRRLKEGLKDDFG